jgi:hypothetical protein
VNPEKPGTSGEGRGDGAGVLAVVAPGAKGLFVVPLVRLICRTKNPTRAITPAMTSPMSLATLRARKLTSADEGLVELDPSDDEPGPEVQSTPQCGQRWPTVAPSERR